MVPLRGVFARLVSGEGEPYHGCDCEPRILPMLFQPDSCSHTVCSQRFFSLVAEHYPHQTIQTLVPMRLFQKKRYGVEPYYRIKREEEENYGGI